MEIVVPTTGLVACNLLQLFIFVCGGACSLKWSEAPAESLAEHLSMAAYSLTVLRPLRRFDVSVCLETFLVLGVLLFDKELSRLFLFAFDRVFFLLAVRAR